MIAVKTGQTYVASLQWKTNQADPGTIFAAAGPTAGQYSQTCLIGQLVPLTTNFTSASNATTAWSKVVTNQGSMGGDGSTWVDMASALSVSAYAPADGVMVIGGNADLLTANAGINQNIAINTNGTIKAWKESGGSAGTFSPNAAFVQAVIPVTFDSTYTIKLQWKAQQATAGKIYFGAGPVPSGTAAYSPTRLTVQFLPTAQKALDKFTNSQYQMAGSDGSSWNALDAVNLTVPFTPTADCKVLVSANVDLWTGTAGVNQNIGITASGGVSPAYPTAAGQPEGWKESGGSNGIQSPNAAYEMIVIPLKANTSYAFGLVWKANQPSGGTIYAGAGPIGTLGFSPTRITVQPIGC
jgi:hypothetical protein